MRKGLSESEIGEMPVTQFYELWVFDTFLEPQGPVVNDFHSAINQYTMYMTSSNMTKKSAKDIKLKDFITIGKGNVFKTPEELELLEKEKLARRAAAIKAQFTDPAVLALINSKAKGEING